METFPREAFVRGIPLVTGDFSHKGQWRGALMFSLICVWTNDWANTRDADDFWDAIAPIMTSLLCMPIESSSIKNNQTII